MKKSAEWLLAGTFALGCSGGTQQERDVTEGFDGSSEVSSDVVFVKDLAGTEAEMEMARGDAEEAIPQELLEPTCLP